MLPKNLTISTSTHSLLVDQGVSARDALKCEFEDAFFEPNHPKVVRLSMFGFWVAPLSFLALPGFSIGIAIASLWMLLFSYPALYFLKRRTQVGQDTALHLNGLKKFIDATESNKFKIDPPPITPKYHNLILPYAVASGCDDEWSDFLHNPINRSSTDNHSSDRYLSNNTYRNCSMSSAISGAVASSAPKSSSSGGGGGSSSGGDGGGGGGF